ncbi:hypothetical protein [Lysobacter tyrosinilyticus]
MKVFLTTIVASIAAVIVQPFVLFIWFLLPDLIIYGAEVSWADLGPLFFYTILFATPFVLLLGIPLSIALWRLGKFRWWPLALVGASAGALFAGWDLPGGDPGYSSGGNWYGQYREFVVAGVPTLYGWLNYIQSVLAFALHGFAGASIYYLVWASVLRPNNSFKPKPLRGSA